MGSPGLGRNEAIASEYQGEAVVVDATPHRPRAGGERLLMGFA